MIDRIATPKGLAVGIMVICGLISAAIIMGAVVITHLGRTDKRVAQIAQRVFLIEQPSAAQRKAGISRAVKELTADEAQALLNRLLKTASPAQRRKLRKVLPGGGGHATNPGSGPAGPGTTPGPSPSLPTVPSVTTPALPVVPVITTPSLTVPSVAVPPIVPLPCLPAQVQHC